MNLNDAREAANVYTRALQLHASGYRIAPLSLGSDFRKIVHPDGHAYCLDTRFFVCSCPYFLSNKAEELACPAVPVVEAAGVWLARAPLRVLP